MELKTLKDLDYWLTNELFYEQGKRRFKWAEEQKLINFETLKAEAVKWVKGKLPPLKEEDLPEASKWRTIPWIINFFNITSEDIEDA